MAEEVGHRLARILSVFVCALMLSGLVVMTPDSAKAYPDNAKIVGNVWDGTSPVENAYVKAMLFIGDGTEINWTLTDVNGDYEMNVPGGLQYVVFVANGSYYMAMDLVTISPGETVVQDFTLVHITEAADVTISGYVTDEDGDPRNDGHVLAMVSNPMGGDMPYYANYTTPDSSGYYTVNVIPGPGGGAAGMDFPGYPMTQNDTEDDFLPGSSHTFNIELKPPSFNDDATVRGYVTDLESGVPLQLAFVSYESNNGMDRYSNWTFTNDTGYYEMRVQSSDYSRLTFQKIFGYTVKFYEVEIPPNGTVQQDAALMKTTAMISGNVTDESTGLPLMFARVYLVDNPNMQENISMTQTNATGCYELGAFEGTDLYFGAEQNGYAKDTTQIDVISGDELWHDFTLVPYNAWLVGQVTDAMTLSPLADAYVRVSGPVEEGEMTNSTGMYNISMIAGDYEIQVDHWMGPIGYKSFNDTIKVMEGVENVYDVALMPWQNAIVRGHVYDIISGDPVPLANIWLSGWWGSSTTSNGTGDYEMLNVDGNYTLNVDVDGYERYSDDLFLPELSTTVVDVGLLPRNPALTVLLRGYVNNSNDSSPVDGAEVRIRLEGGQYETGAWTNETGYYAMDAPAWVVNVRVTAAGHAPYFGQVDLTGLTDYWLDVVLDWDLYSPNITYSQFPLVNISQVNPCLIDVVVEEENLREMVMMYFIELNSSGLDSNWTLLRYNRTSFDPWQLEDNLPYTMIGDNYSVNIVWDTTGLIGLLSNGVDGVYIMTLNWPWYLEPAFAIGAAYSNATTPRMEGTALFNTTSGQFMAFFPNGPMPPIEEFDATSVLEPNAFVIEYDDGIPIFWDMRYLVAWDANDVTLTTQMQYPSGKYKTQFFVNDWGNPGNGTMNDLTVDNDYPVAVPEAPSNVATNLTVTLDGRNSTDNVGVSDYLWEFYNETGVWTQLWGAVVTYSFKIAGSYDINLTVWDGAGHSSMDSVTVDVFADSTPIADAGSDQTVDQGTLVTFDGSGSWDDNGIVNYTWEIAELAVVLYEVAPQYLFSDAGLYNVSLVVLDGVGHVSAPDEVVITVNDTTAPEAKAGDDQVVLLVASATFDGSNSSDNVGIVNYTWSFFDGAPFVLYDVVASHMFTAPGLYTITLNVSDAAGNWDTDELNVTVISDAVPIADAWDDQTVDEDTVVTFDGSHSWDDKGIVNYTWTIWSLSVVMYEVGPTFTFTEPGVYNVSLVVIDTVGQVSAPDEMNVTVLDVTPPFPDAGGPKYVNNGTQVTFDASGSYDNVGIVNYTWLFSDVTSFELYGMTVNYTFTAPGDYQVWLTVTDDSDNSDMVDVWAYVNGPPNADSLGDFTTDAGSWVSFPGWMVGDDRDPWWLMSFEWSFIYAGENVTLYDPNPSYQFLIPGEYTVYLTVTDMGGLQDNASYVITVVQNPSAWWIDPVLGGRLADGTTVAVDQIVLAGHIDQDSEVDVITVDGTFRVFSNSDGDFEVTLNLSEGLNVVNLVTYNDDWGMMMTLVKMIISDTDCRLWVDSVDSPTASSTVEIGGWTDPDAEVTVNGVPVAVGPDGTFSTDVALVDGDNLVNVTAIDAVGNMNWAEFSVDLDTTPPTPVIESPTDGAVLNESNVLVHGTVESGAVVRVNGVLATGDTSWSATVSLVEGSNSIVITATDSVGNTATQTIVVSYVPPEYVTPEELEAIRAELLGKIDNLTESLTENVTALRDQINAALNDTAALRDSLLENISALQAQINATVIDIQALEDSLANSTAALQAQIDDAVLDIAELMTSVDENITALKTQAGDAASNITKLQASLQENVTALQNLQANVTALATSLAQNVTALDGMIDALSWDLDDLQDELTAVNNSLTSIQDELSDAIDTLEADLADLQQQIDELKQTTDDVEEQANETDSFAGMLMYLTLILFVIAVIMVALVWYLTSKKLGKGGAGAPPSTLEEVEGPTEVEKEFESLEKELKEEEL